ncbi:CoA-acylating methylmalonate-semialdehyde dehydrogenase [Oceanobacillus polygoni]|uniref:methylmalonate-semialdehyde dehydrogenase (CoA acylating) n=1 Tax=Oceanobacillus polygoni TaxID=1235259 RepID=A0A9X1CA72_9BACI|nr:CoA-acylating methylmalonate-semialdehyde dehydrogenase [Oceanobacillus polygoni]MBP2076254.1 malonate-semialdehyde dehydrogenase (acetylating)/methylmalonate-semialdehyde dehydrogenase [Oceanobacillus polygoni]
MATLKLDTVTHYINGEKVKGNNDKYGYVYSPSTGQRIAAVPYASAEEVDETVQLAKKAAVKWAKTSVGKRVEVLFKFRQLLVENTDELAQLIGKENGKTISDAKGEISRGIESVDLAIGAPQILKGEHSVNVGGDINAYSMKQPLGVVTCISPFNFPVMVPLAMSAMAVAVGNAMILKPSEKVPYSAQLISELWEKAGLPAGVWNVLNGDKDTVNAIITHNDIQAVSFVGSTKVAEIIYEVGTKHHKRVNAFGGGKNHLVIMPDADIDKAVDSFLGSAYGSASQRCMAVSVAMPVGQKTADVFTAKLKEKVENLRPGSYDDESADFGAVISAEAKQSILNSIDEAVRDGANVVVDGRNPDVKFKEGFYLGATLLDNVTPEMNVYKEEVFGPARTIVSVDSIGEAIQLINNHQYGNGVAIFTNSGRDARKFTQEIEVGMVGVNVPIPIPVGYHNFGGWKGSRLGEGQMFGPDTARFFTKTKTVSERWFDQSRSDEINFDFPSS